MNAFVNDRFTRTPGGTRIAFRVAGVDVDGRGGGKGDGAAMVLTNGLTTTDNFWAQLRPRWERSHRVLSWDLPGHGESGPAACDDDARIAGQPAIVAQLMDELGMDSAVQVGWSTGCQVVLELARRMPARVTALMLLLGGAGRVLDTAELPLPGAVLDWVVRRTPAPVFAAAVDVLTRIANAPGGQLLPRRLNLIGPATTDADARRITEHLRRIDAPTVQAMVASAQAHSAWEALGAIEHPTLIVGGDLDPFAPSATVAVPMHAAMPHSRLLRLTTGTHTALLEQAGEIGTAADEFLASLPRA